jgi:hypothetical protein
MNAPMLSTTRIIVHLIVPISAAVSLCLSHNVGLRLLPLPRPSTLDAVTVDQQAPGKRQTILRTPAPEDLPATRVAIMAPKTDRAPAGKQGFQVIAQFFSTTLGQPLLVQPRAQHSRPSTYLFFPAAAQAGRAPPALT